VVVVGETIEEPDVAFDPDQPPVAVQDVAFAELQYKVEEAPLTMDVGSA
jgi:hypothetical protein